MESAFLDDELMSVGALVDLLIEASSEAVAQVTVTTGLHAACVLDLVPVLTRSGRFGEKK